MTSKPVLVPAARWARWVENFGTRHGTTVLRVDGRLHGTAEDGSTFTASLPFDHRYEGPAETSAFLAEVVPPELWGVLLVRKGGFAVARLAGEAIVDSKTGQRHVQGRTKAGGQSQQRFARRRDNQARAAYDAAADHAARILAGVPVLVAGGDEPAVRTVLADPRLRIPAAGLVSHFLGDLPDPRRSVLDQAVADASAVRIDVVNA